MRRMWLYGDYLSDEGNEEMRRMRKSYMKILAIETSCDETAISIIEIKGESPLIDITILTNVIHSQIELHREYGGVFPALAKREHAKNLVPVLKEALDEAGLQEINKKGEISQATREKLEAILEREPELLEQFLAYMPTVEVPTIDAIAVTYGPGLEPALWVGVNFAKALALVWEKPLIPINHMEGHIFSAFLEKKSDATFTLTTPAYPTLALLISGGHTEIILMKEGLDYTLIGETRDDAVGEAFDKVARMLGLPYPGGPEISKLAERIDEEAVQESGYEVTLPRPMLHREDFDFSFSGLKTAVLTVIKKAGELTEEQKIKIAYEFQEAVTEVLVKKTMRALEEYGAKTLVLGGGVSANARIREEITKQINNEYPEVKLFLPALQFTTDNALMIALAAYQRHLHRPQEILESNATDELKAYGTLRLGKS